MWISLAFILAKCGVALMAHGVNIYTCSSPMTHDELSLVHATVKGESKP